MGQREKINAIEAKSIIEDYYYPDNNGKKDDLKKMTNLLSYIDSKESKYITGILFYQKNMKFENYDIIGKKKFELVKSTVKMTNSVDFHISTNTNTILFNNSKAPTQEGKTILSEILFKKKNKINNYTFDIQAIEADVIDKKLNGMWTFSFKDRQGKIQSGVAYGKEVNLDPMYNLTKGAPKNFIGIEIKALDQIIKVRVSRKGSISIYTNFDDITHTKDVFALVESFKKYGKMNGKSNKNTKPKASTKSK